MAGHPEKTIRRPVIIVQQRIIPYYRRRLFERLSSCEEAHISIAAHSGEDEPGLKTLSEAEREHIRFIDAPLKTFRAGRWAQFFWQPAAVNAVWRQRPDAVIAESNPYSLTAWALGCVCRRRGIKVFLWTHGLLENETGPKWWVRRCLYRLADGFLLYGDYAKALLIDKGFDPQKLHVVYNSLDYDAQMAVAETLDDGDTSAFRRDLGVAEGEGLVAFSGRLQPNKRLDMLIGAIAQVAADGKRVHVALIGDGSERTKLETLADDYGVSDLIHFLGAAYDENINGLLYSASDLCVIPSGAGLTVMHALAYGTPVLLHNRAGEHFPECEAVTEGVTGFFYDHGDIKSMAESIMRAIFRGDGKRTMSSACKAVIEDRYIPEQHAIAIVRAVAGALS